MSELLRLDGVSVAYGKRRALDGVSLTVSTGEIVTLLGANGSGKSTTLRTISGLVRPSAGRVVLDGRDITRAAPDAIVTAGVGHVPEGREIFPEFTVHENLLVGGHTAPRAAIAEATERAFTLFPVLGQRARQLAGTLSGGEQQMLALSRVMMTGPRLLMIDELALGLAPKTVDRLMGMVRRINEAGTTVILVEQSLNRALSLAQRCFFMERGEIRFDGPTAELMSRDDLLRPVFLGTAAAGLG